MLVLVRDELKFVAAPSVSLAELKAARLPVLGNPDDPLALLVWGDSHAMALLPAIAQLCREHRVSAVYAVHSNTAPVIDYEHTLPFSRQKEAPVFAKAVMHYVKEHSIPNVLLAARWSSYFEEEARIDAASEGAKSKHVPFADALCDTVSSVISAGAQPYIFAEVPNCRVNVPKALRIRGMFGASIREFFCRPHIHADATKEMSVLFPSLSDKGAITIDVSPLFLSDDQQHYRMDVQGRALYVDKHHLSRAGALHVAQELAPCLSRTPPYCTPATHNRSPLHP
jgi:hypothetical protein